MDIAATARKRRARDPQATREAILEAACVRLAQDGPEGLSLSEVAHLAGVNRGTAYQHFETREKLVRATTEWVSWKLYRAVFGDPEQVRGRPVETVDVAELSDRMAGFAMANPALCRIWLLTVLASPDPSSDVFWREYLESINRFAATDLAQPGIDTEALTVIMMAGTFLWPVWAEARGDAADRRGALAQRFADECLRLSLFGTMRAEHYPDVLDRVKKRGGAPPIAGE
ncbi:TetR/AcrR family transcriptional regulator [Sphingomonas naphthae]|uniref:TetR/AcrR family transcriptional regulator n=1 Tax=Sphingomonas naphthae TaxID=1813468 RepID=A0ABY7TJS6_9SPHN|nr:TetR/AcrR family transcriptional regulator [Sphingomonas naphthae]WCT73031.1 TetR/AcrR family transcriptional regulator [Sphingomonas naphthae]